MKQLLLLYMKLHISSYIVLLLALTIVHTGFAQSEFLLCQNRCEQAQQTETELPPCCIEKMGNSHSSAQAESHNMDTSGCPHVNTNKKITDPLPLLTVSTASPCPDTSPAFSGVILSPFIQRNIFTPAVHPKRSGLPPPGSTVPPYHLHCSLLI